MAKKKSKSAPKKAPPKGKAPQKRHPRLPQGPPTRPTEPVAYQDEGVSTRTVGKIDPKKAAAQLSTTRNRGDRANWFSIKENGDYEVVLFPPVAPMESPWVTHWSHSLRIGQLLSMFEVQGERGDGSLYSFKTSLSCIHLHGGAVCPACLVEDWIKANGKSGISVAPKSRFLMNLYHAGQYMIWEAPATIVGDMVKYAEAEGWEAFETPSPWNIKRYTDRRGKKAWPAYTTTYLENHDLPVPENWLGDVRDLTGEIRFQAIDVMIDCLQRAMGRHVPLADAFKDHKELLAHL